MDKSVKDIERLSDKLQKIYVDLNKKLEEFMTYKAKQEQMEELNKELVKTVDQINLNLDQYVKAEDLEAVKFALTDLEKQLTTIKTHGVPKEELPPNLQRLQEQKEEIESLINALEEQYQERKISSEEFNKSKEMNLKKLGEIEKKIEQESKKMDSMEESPTPVPIKTEVELKPKTVKLEDKKEIEEPQKPEKIPVKKETPPVEELQSKEEKPKKPLLSGRERLVFELKDLLDKGLISKEAFDRTKRVLSK
jgi:chromosome segregation ATPase